MFSLIFFIFLSLASNPDLLTLSQKNECIKILVYQFITSNTCEKLSQNIKSHLAIKMTNCLFQQMGKEKICPELILNQNMNSGTHSGSSCKLEGDSWNTFTIFFAHIDNLCHFYWDLSKAQRTEQMVDALLESSRNSQKVLTQNNEATKQILELQTSLKIQILSSMATQEQMADLLANSSHILNSLTSELSSSLNRIHEDIEHHYAVINRILSAVNQVLKNLDIIYGFLMAEASSLQGVLYFISLVLFIFIGCLLSYKVRTRRNELLIITSFHFLVEYFLGWLINAVVGIQSMRCASVLVMLLLIIITKSSENVLQKCVSSHLNSERMSRIMQKAIKNELLNRKRRHQVRKMIEDTPPE